MQWIQSFLYTKLHLTTLLISSLIIANCDSKAAAKDIPETETDKFSNDFQRSKSALKSSNLDILQLYNQTNILSQLPNPVPPEPKEPKIPQPQPTPETPLEVAPPSDTESEPFSDIPGTVTVSEFDFQGNTVFSDEELQQTVADFIGKPITFSQLLQVEEIIRDKYTEGCRLPDEELPCYINSGAVIVAEQVIEPENATIAVKVMEGELENIEITGTRGLNESYIRSRLRGGISKPLEREKLLERLQLLQLDPLISNISAELSAGSRPNKSSLKIDVIEADPFFVELFTDNGRAPSVGSWRRGIRVYENNLLGFGDRVFFQWANTDGSDASERYLYLISLR
jgi:hemolysin activation/secretion protein